MIFRLGVIHPYLGLTELIFCVCYRIVALAEPVIGRGQQWLSPEILSLFIFHEMRNLSKNEEIFIINTLVCMNL